MNPTFVTFGATDSKSNNGIFSLNGCVCIPLPTAAGNNAFNKPSSSFSFSASKQTYDVVTYISPIPLVFCFDAEKEKEEEGLLNALLPAAVGNGMQTQPLRLKIPLFDLESVAPKVTNVGFMQNRTSLIMLFKDKAFKPKEFVDVDDIESVVETINLQLRQRANDISNARLLASMAEVALRDRNIRNGKAARELSDSKFYQVAHLANDKMRDDVNVLMDARARYSDENINSNVVMVKNNEGEDVALNEDEIKLLPNAISQMKVKHANEVAELRREHSQRTLELNDRYAKKIKELEARIHTSEEAAHNEREDRNKIVKGLNEQVHKLKDFVKSADSEASLNVKSWTTDWRRP
jgi:hypothetical protein